MIVSVIAIMQQPILNRDGALYLKAAQVFSESGFHAARIIFDWPFYSIMIAWAQKFTRLSFLNSAYLINTFLIAGIIFLLLEIIRYWKQDDKIIWFAVLMMLVQPYFFKLRVDVIRDFGYWFFYLAAFYTLLRYSEYQKHHWRLSLLFQVLIGCAFLFRFEAAVFLGTSVVFLFDGRTSFKNNFIRLMQFNLLPIIFLAIIILTYPDLFHRFVTVFAIFKDYATQFQANVVILKTLILNDFSDHFAKWLLGFLLVGLALCHFISTTHILYFCGVIYALIKKRTLTLMTQIQKRIWLIWCLFNLILISIFVSNYYFLSGRYLMPLIFLLLLLIPIDIEPLLARKNWRIFFVILFLIFCGFDIKHMLKKSHEELRTIGLWIKTHTLSDSIIFTDDPRIGFYADRKYFPIDHLKSMKLRPQDCVVQKHNSTQWQVGCLLFPRTAKATFSTR